MKVECEVFRFSPGFDKGPRYDAYALEVDPTETALDVLVRIHRDHDPELAFRFACGVVKCGECAIVVNGSPCLACDRPVEARMKIEPLPHLPLIKDLVVDRRGVFDRIFELLPHPSASEGPKECLDAIGREEAAVRIQRTVTLTKCFECLICLSTCPVYEDEKDAFPGPLGMLWLAQACLHPGYNPVSRNEIESSMQACLRCGACSQNCPCAEDVLGLALDILDGG
jgi:succinate dehydrogenase/fumarate reductase iron-sulfur protein